MKGKTKFVKIGSFMGKPIMKEVPVKPRISSPMKAKSARRWLRRKAWKVADTSDKSAAFRRHFEVCQKIA